MNTKDKGTLGEAIAIAHYVQQGFEVAIPLGDRRPYDLIVDKGDQLVKVQVKYTTSKRVDIRVGGGNRSGHTHKRYKADDFDELLVVTSWGDVLVFDSVDILDKTEVRVSYAEVVEQQTRWA